MTTAGEKLKEARLERRLTLEDVSKTTKIKESFLKAIEEGDYQNLPSVAYAQGFVRNYANAVELSENEILALFRREFDEDQYLRVLPRGFEKTDEFPIRRFRIRQTVLIFGLAFLFIVGFIIFQYRSAFLDPSLEIYSPKEGESISSSTVRVNGKTEVNSTVFVNEFPVTVGANGAFNKIITVFPGKTSITIKTVNQFGKETTKRINFDVKGGT